MIQAPQMQYMPVQQNYAGQGAVNTQPYQQPIQQQPMPGSFYNYPTASAYAPSNSVSTERAQYNGVNIEVFNPQGQGITPGAMPQCAMPAQFVPVQQPVMPAYQQPIQQPVQPAFQQPQVQQFAPQAAPAPFMTPEPQIMQPGVNAGPVVAAAAPVIEQPAEQVSGINPVSFANRLNSGDADVELSALEEVADTIKNKGDEGKALIDTDIVDALVGIINKDTSALEGPSPEVIELRQQLNSGKTLSDAEAAKANTSTPLEKSEQNKQYALYTLSYMHNRILDETANAGVPAPELKDLPAIETVVEAVKSNPDPMVRVSAISALSHIARPEYKADLNTIFTLAKEDEDADVAAEAARAADALNNQ